MTSKFWRIFRFSSLIEFVAASWYVQKLCRSQLSLVTVRYLGGIHSQQPPHQSDFQCTPCLETWRESGFLEGSGMLHKTWMLRFEHLEETLCMVMNDSEQGPLFPFFATAKLHIAGKGYTIVELIWSPASLSWPRVSLLYDKVGNRLSWVTAWPVEDVLQPAWRRCGGVWLRCTPALASHCEHSIGKEDQGKKDIRIACF